MPALTLRNTAGEAVAISGLGRPRTVLYVYPMTGCPGAGRLVLEAADIEGVALRYGTFYGPKTWYSRDGDIGRQIVRRRYPVIGPGEGVTSFIHIGDAAEACAAFVGRGRPGVYNVVDDDSATANGRGFQKALA